MTDMEKGDRDNSWAYVIASGESSDQAQKFTISRPVAAARALNFGGIEVRIEF
jgi:hypothetical protein